MAAGAATLGVILLIVLHFRRDPTQELASKAGRVDLVEGMQVELALASEAEKSAVLATTDGESQAFADQSRAVSAKVEQDRDELGKLLASGGTEGERNLLAQFSTALANLRHIDEEVLLLAVQNTNVKAYGLLFGPAASTLADMDGALARVIARAADSPDAKQVMALAFGARLGVLRIQALLAPHIAEESEAKEDQMEASMANEEMAMRKDLDGLAALPALQGDVDLATATSGFGHYGEIKTRILALSRENSNVKSLALSLNQKRKAMVACMDALNALQQALLEEPIPNVAYGRVLRNR